jgi:hypothetical protein
MDANIVRVKARGNVLGLKPGDVVDLPDHADIRNAAAAGLVEIFEDAPVDAEDDDDVVLDGDDDDEPEAKPKPRAKRQRRS